MPRYMFVYESANPHGTICDECEADLGRLFEAWERRSLPRHRHCWCYYQRVTVRGPVVNPERPWRRPRREDLELEEWPVFPADPAADPGDVEDGSPGAGRPAVEREDTSGPQLSRG